MKTFTGLFHQILLEKYLIKYEFLKIITKIIFNLLNVHINLSRVHIVSYYILKFQNTTFNINFFLNQNQFSACLFIACCIFFLFSNNLLLLILCWIIFVCVELTSEVEIANCSKNVNTRVFCMCSPDMK